MSSIIPVKMANDKNLISRKRGGTKKQRKIQKKKKFLKLFLIQIWILTRHVYFGMHHGEPTAYSYTPL